MTTTEYQYGLADHRLAITMNGGELLQAIIDGKFPQAPISKTMSFWIVEVGDN